MRTGILSAALAAPVAASPEGAPPPPPGAPVAAPLAGPAETLPEPGSFRVGVVPGVAWPETGDVEGMSVNLLGGMAENVQGLEVGMGLNWDRGDFQGFQGTFGANLVDGDVQGVQASLGANVSGGQVRGVQVSSGVNVAIAGIHGVQAATGVNLAGDVVGGQASCGLNLARSVQGVQVGMANGAQRVDGVQVGMVNAGGKVDGVQVGLVNVAKDVDGVSLGLLNFVAHGRNAPRLYASEMNWLNVGMKFGSRPFHTFLGVGQDEPGSKWWSTGVGLGGHVEAGRLWFDLDAQLWNSYRGVSYANPNLITRAELEAGLRVFEHFSPFVGVALSTSWNGGGVHPIAPIGGRDEQYQEALAVTWPGFVAGLEF
jgi:hypothetical protein